MANTSGKKESAEPSSRAAAGVELEVRDFGPIAEGSINLRPLTVFAGPSNTGKSWMATLIYVMGQYLALRRSPRLGGRFGGDFYRMSQRMLMEDEISIKIPENPKNWLDAFRTESELYLTPSETETVRRVIKKIAGEEVSHQLQRCYGVSRLSDLARQADKSKFSIAFNIGDIEYRLEDLSKSTNDPNQNLDGDLFQVTLPEKVEILSGAKDSKLKHELLRLLGSLEDDLFFEDETELAERSEYLQERYGYIFSSYIVENLENMSSNDIGQIYYLPADRGGIMHSHSVVVSALIRSASQAGLRPESPLPVLSGVLADFLDKIVSIGKGRQHLVGRKRGSHISKKLEDRILRGKIELRRSEAGYPMFFYQQENWKGQYLPLMTSSSMVSELSPVVLFFRYLLSRGDTLILEEPEAHLHPASQKQFIEEIASWVDAGMKVVLTTHSEWILEGLSNIVARGESEENSSEDSISLKKEEVGVWLFNHIDPEDIGEGSRIQEIPWDTDKGGYEADFYDVAVDLQNDWARSVNWLDDERAGA